jgi:hypothetical protein
VLDILARRVLPFLLLLCSVAGAQTINCPSGFSSSGTCGVSNPGAGGQNFQIIAGGGVGVLAAPNVTMIATGQTHQPAGLIYQTAVNAQAFTATFTFVPNGQNIAFVLQNNNNANASGTTDPRAFSSGAGCEAGFFQAFGTAPTSANNIFALELDSYSYLTSSPGTFTYSSAQIYQTNQSPCDPDDSSPVYYPTNKISTSPVPFNSPATSQGTTTGDTYSATVTYDGATLTLTLFDVTAGGSCPGASCFTNSWSNISIPSLVNGATAYAGFTAATGVTSTSPLTVKSLVYTVNTPTGTLGFTSYNAGSTYNNGTTSTASPVCSLAPGTYSGAQTLTCTTSTSGGYICYTFAASQPVILPQTDNMGGCQSGTPYTGPIPISSTGILYAMASTNLTKPPSTLVAAAYTITAAAPAIAGMSGKITSNATLP